MGFATTVHILNDAMGSIEDNPAQFVAGIVRAMHGGGTVAVGGHANYVQVMPTAHASTFRLYLDDEGHLVELDARARGMGDLLKTPASRKRVKAALKVAKMMLKDLEREIKNVEASLPKEE